MTEKELVSICSGQAASTSKVNSARDKSNY